MATSSSRAQILNDFQGITGMNIEDAIHFLEQYQWKLHDIINDYYDGINLKPNHDLSLGRFYSIDNNRTKQHDEDSDRHYAELLNADQWKRSEPIYHEKQRLMRCGLHSLNNLFQTPKLFTRAYLESIVQEYDKRTFFNDYRTLWLGNYDLRILIQAIERFGFDVRQVEIYRRESLSNLRWDFFGLLINLNGTHWFTIKNLNGIYYNLDSTLHKPIRIGMQKDLIDYLYRLIHRTQTIYLFVVTQKK